MKTARFLFAMISCGSLALGLGFAAQTPNQPSKPASSATRLETGSDRTLDQKHRTEAQGKDERTEGKHPEGKQGGGRDSDRSGKAVAKPGSPTRPPNLNPGARDPNRPGHPGQRPVGSAQTKSALAKDGDCRRTAASTLAGPRQESGRINQTDNPRRPTMVSAAAGPSAGLSLNPGRNPRAGSAAIGGLANSSAKNTAVISGTGMRHRP